MPVELVFVAEFDSVQEAWEMERRVHGWSRAKREALIAGEWNQLQRLASRSKLRPLIEERGEAAPSDR